MIGIYMITNKINGKKYIGQSINLEKRLRYHKANKQHNEYLTRAINKYGVENFEFTILEECSIELLDQKERSLIQCYQTTNPKFGYNIEKGGNLNKHLSDETKLKLSLKRLGKCLSPETRQKISKANMGKHKEPLSIEAKNQISNTLKVLYADPVNHPMFGKCHSDTAREKMSQAHKPEIPTAKKEIKRMGSMGTTNNKRVVENEVKQIRDLYANKIYNQNQLAAIYGIDQTQISNIVRYKSWKNI